MIFKFLWLNDWPFFLSVGWNVSPQETEFVSFSSTLNVMIFVALGEKKEKKSPFKTSGVCPSYFLLTDVIEYLARLKYMIPW